MRLNENMDDLDAIREGSIETEHQPLQSEATQSEMQMRREKKNDTKDREKMEQEVGAAGGGGAHL